MEVRQAARGQVETVLSAPDLSQLDTRFSRAADSCVGYGRHRAMDGLEVAGVFRLVRVRGRRLGVVSGVVALVLVVGLAPLAASAAPARVDSEVERALGNFEDTSSEGAEESRLKQNDPDRAAGSAALSATAAAAGHTNAVKGFAVFPVAGSSSFSDSYGAPRPGGRNHAGIDIFAPKLTAVIAVADGVVVKATATTGRAGTYVVIEHPDKSRSYYLHLNNDSPDTDDGLGQGIAPGIEKGVAVTAGTVIGFVGDSGNAEDTPSHLHFEFRAGGAGVVNPYELLLAAQKGEVGVLGIHVLPYTGAGDRRNEVMIAALLITLGFGVIRRSSDIEKALALGGPWVTLGLGLLLWRQKALDRLMGYPGS